MIAFVALTPLTAFADENCGSMSSQEVETRLDYLAHVFDREVHAIETWSYVWGSVPALAAVGQGVALTLTHDYGTRVDLSVGIVTSLIGVLSLGLLPLRLTLPMRNARWRWAEADRCAVLGHAEATLERVARDQALATGGLTHLGNIALNTGVVLVLGLGYDRWTTAAISGGAGVVIGELTAFTQPNHLNDALEEYRAGRIYAPTSKASWSIGPTIEKDAWGAALRASW